MGLLGAENIVLTTKVTWEVIILFLWRKISIELKLLPKKYSNSSIKVTFGQWGK